MRNSLLIGAGLAVLVGSGAAVYVLQNQEATDEGARITATVSSTTTAPSAELSQSSVPSSVPSAVDLTTAFNTDAYLSAPLAVAEVPTLRASSAASSPAKKSVKPAASPAQKQPTRFRISGGSHANFLAGSPEFLIGSSRSVAGTITLDWKTPSRSSISTLAVSAGALDSADVGLRSIQMNASLPEDENIVFIPSGVSGWPKAIKIGTPFTLNLSGALQIAEESRPATFRGALTPNANGTLTGSLTAVINRSDFNLDYASPDDQEQIKFMIRIIAKAQ